MAVDGLKDLFNKPFDATGVSCTSIKRLWKEKDLTLVELIFHLQQRDTDCPDAFNLMI